MEENKVTSPGIKGLIIALVLIVLSAIVIVMNLFQNKMVTAATIVVFFGGIIWSCISFSNQMNGNVTFGNIFSHGFKASAAVAVLVALWTLLAVSFLFPDMMDQIMEAQRAALEKQGLDEGEIDNRLRMAAKITKPFMIIGSVFMYLIAGAIASLIGAAVSKKNPNPVMPE